MRVVWPFHSRGALGVFCEARCAFAQRAILWLLPVIIAGVCARDAHDVLAGVTSTLARRQDCARSVRNTVHKRCPHSSRGDVTIYSPTRVHAGASSYFGSGAVPVPARVLVPAGRYYTQIPYFGGKCTNADPDEQFFLTCPRLRASYLLSRGSWSHWRRKR
ncbi:hypothetical protein C8F04DRAFT_1271595 [Mycena alexandri]|uniref:Uncharacterized protein n=1 Tax=Mycena alexandri TaxID=1745969 RepID=A0AAD6SAT0_9AGAR|nr:hypothetical protein C8F04DRAFT_1271595 [Mycena alexandri]